MKIFSYLLGLIKKDNKCKEVEELQARYEEVTKDSFRLLNQLLND